MTQRPDPYGSGAGWHATPSPAAQSARQGPTAFPQAPPIPPGYGYGHYAEEPVPPGMFFDEQSGLLLPQGIELASIGRRIGAFFLTIPLLIVTLGIGYMLWALIAWGNGQTPALQVLGMRCWTPGPSRVPSWWRMALREVVGGGAECILGFITLLLSFVLMVTSHERKALHDDVAATVVVRDPNKVLSS
jgi:uncharacterized RDD family membrane protein YckC